MNRHPTTLQLRPLHRRLCILVAALLGIAAIAHAESPGADDAALLLPFKKQLMGTLQSALKESPEAAIMACQQQAPHIPGQAAPAGMEVGRASHKARNPDNQPNNWQQEWIDYYLSHAEDRVGKRFRLQDGRMAYVEPIVMQPMCLTCHGSNISDSVQTLVDKHYPHDQATGFSTGELRGIFWLTRQARDGE